MHENFTTLASTYKKQILSDDDDDGEDDEFFQQVPEVITPMSLKANPNQPNSLQQAMQKKVLGLFEHQLTKILEANPPLPIVTKSLAP